MMAHLPCQAVGQSFTKVTDPVNPIVSDMNESGGGSWLDFDNDGWLDLFVSNGNLANQNNALYLNLGQGQFRRITTGAVVTDGGSSIGSTGGDYNEDGLIDLFVTNRNFFGNFLYAGDGDTAFTRILAGTISSDLANSNSSSWVDLDRDGDLDLYVINFSGPDYMYVNSGYPDYQLSRIDTGIVTGNGFSISGVWADYDNDGDQDLFIGNGGTEHDRLFINQGHFAFSQISFADGRATLGSSWADYDNDGDMDLVTASYLNQRNQLYLNSGAPDFDLVAVDTGVVSTDLGSSVGTGWGDYDSDGDLDLLVANDGQRKFLYANSGPPYYAFTKVESGPVVEDSSHTFGCVWADYDNDGDLDVFLANRLNEKNTLLLNAGNGNHWIELDLAGTSSNRSAIGARVRLKAVISGVARWQMREVSGQSGYNSQILRLHVGLGDASVVDSLIIEWPSDSVEVYTNLNANHIYKMTEGQGYTVVAVSSGESASPQKFELHRNFPNPFNPSTSIRFGLNRGARVQLKVYNLLGQEVRTLVNQTLSNGEHTVTWDGRDDKGIVVASGVYIYRLTNGTSTSARKMVFMK